MLSYCKLISAVPKKCSLRARATQQYSKRDTNESFQDPSTQQHWLVHDTSTVSYHLGAISISNVSTLEATAHRSASCGIHHGVQRVTKASNNQQNKFAIPPQRLSEQH